MQSGSGDDLFRGFNEVEVNEVLRRCVGCGRFVLIGPPRSGKTFFRENYLEDRLGAGVTVDEHTLGITTTTKTEGKEAKGELGIREKVMRILEGMIPLIRRLRSRVSVEDEELRRILGDKAPRPIVEGARGMIGDSPHRAYYIPWDSDEVGKCVDKPSACAFGADVGKALKLIKEAFGDKKRIKWFEAEYIPPGLVEEVIELIKEKGEDGVREVLRSWVEAYSKASETLSKILGVREELFEWESLSVVFLNNFVNNYAKYVIGSLATALMGAASLALISVLTYMAFKKEGENYLKEVIELRRSLERLLVKGPDGRLNFNELGELLVYRVAYAMGMSYDEAKKALMDITGLSIDELERSVNEIKGKIEELEEKFKLFRQEEPAGIVTADANEFAKGRIYPNIKVESGELRVRVGDGYHSIVRAGKFNELANEVRGRLLKQGFVVVVGPKGIGKSTLAAAVIWELFMNGDIGLVARVDVLNEDNYSRFKTFIENYSEELVKYFGRLLILYDPVSTEAYERVDIDVEAPIQISIERTVNNLMNAIKSISSEASKPLTLIVIPSDIYNALSNDMRAKLESHSLDVSQGLINTELLAELIREYSKTKDKPNGCSLSIDVLSKLAGELAKFDSGHALIARLVGEELARNNCSDREVEKLISKAKGKAEKFIILHINGLFKVHENPDTAKALVEIFALRRPFVNKARPSDPILTPGIVKLIGEERRASLLYGAEGGELRGWLAIRQHDLIEDSIEGLLRCIADEGEECKKFDDELLEPWRDVHVPKIRSRTDAVKYFTRKYGKRFIKKLRKHKNCWKRAALIIGHALAGFPIVPWLKYLSALPKNLGKGFAELLGDALCGCGVDDYLLVGDKIPQLIMNLIRNYAHALVEAFIDEYNEAVAEVRRVLGITKGRVISGAEGFYGLGLASIIAKAVESGKSVKPGDADVVLNFALSAIQFFALIDLIMPILSILDALKPLRAEAPHRYLELLALASNMGNLDRDTVGHIFKELKELSEILSSYGYEVEGRAWSLVIAIITYADLLVNYLGHFNSDEVEGAIRKVADLLNELDRSKPSLGVIAWAIALGPALIHGDVRRLMEEKLGIDVVDKANEILGKLSKLRDEVQELMGDKEFMSYIESKYIKTDEEAVKKVILDTASHVLGNCLVSLALTGGDERVEKIKELLEKHWWVLNANYEASVLARLMLNALLGLKDRKDQLGSELEGKLVVESLELIDAFGSHMHSEFLPALMVAFGVKKPEDGIGLCLSNYVCENSVLAVKGDSAAVKQLRDRLIIAFRVALIGRLISFRELGVDANEFRGLVSGLDGKSLVQLLAPRGSMARLALMLRALINGDEELAKAHALYGAVYATGSKLLTRLFLEAYKACCDLKNNESFRRAVAGLFFYHV
jgi:KaiC/GvpD/RAD55 family RecA-like ATPase